jgi:hypothetical protein
MVFRTRAILKPDIDNSRIRLLRKRDEFLIYVKPGRDRKSDDLYIGGLVKFAMDEWQGRARLARETICHVAAHDDVTIGELIDIYDEVASPLMEDLAALVMAELRKTDVEATTKAGVPMLLEKARSDALSQQRAELEVFAEAPAPFGHTSSQVTVSGNVYGVIQTGANSSAQVEQTFSVEFASQLRDVLRELRQDLATGKDLHESEPALVLIDSADAELARERPAERKVVGFLQGLSAVVGTLSNTPAAYHTLRALAAAHGVFLP